MEKLKHQKIFNFNFISDMDHQLTIEHIMSNETYSIKEDLYPFLITPNVDQLVKFSESKLKDLRKFYEKSAYIFPDGQPIVWSSKLLKKPLHSRLTGSDFFPKIWERIKNENKKTLLIVPSENIAQKLEDEYTHCKCYVPPFFQVGDLQYENIKHDIFDLMISF